MAPLNGTIFLPLKGDIKFKSFNSLSADRFVDLVWDELEPDNKIEHIIDMQDFWKNPAFGMKKICQEWRNEDSLNSTEFKWRTLSENDQISIPKRFRRKKTQKEESSSLLRRNNIEQAIENIYIKIEKINKQLEAYHQEDGMYEYIACARIETMCESNPQGGRHDKKSTVKPKITVVGPNRHDVNRLLQTGEVLTMTEEEAVKDGVEDIYNHIKKQYRLDEIYHDAKNNEGIVAPVSHMMDTNYYQAPPPPPETTTINQQQQMTGIEIIEIEEEEENNENENDDDVEQQVSDHNVTTRRQQENVISNIIPSNQEVSSSSRSQITNKQQQYVYKSALEHKNMKKNKRRKLFGISQQIATSNRNDTTAPPSNLLSQAINPQFPPPDTLLGTLTGDNNDRTLSMMLQQQSSSSSSNRPRKKKK